MHYLVPGVYTFDPQESVAWVELLTRPRTWFDYTLSGNRCPHPWRRLKKINCTKTKMTLRRFCVKDLRRSKRMYYQEVVYINTSVVACINLLRSRRYLSFAQVLGKPSILATISKLTCTCHFSLYSLNILLSL